MSNLVYAQTSSQQPGQIQAATAVDTAGSGHEVMLKSRQFVPEFGVDPALADTAAVAADGSTSERIHVLMQFDEIPNSEQVAALAAEGITLLDYVPVNTWFASVPADSSAAAIGTSEETGIVHWVGAIQVEDKLSSAITEGKIGDWARVSPGRAIILMQVFADVDLETFLNELAGVDVRVISQTPALRYAALDILETDIHALAARDEVQWIEAAPPPPQTMNDGARQAANADNLENPPYNLAGAGVTALVYDGGVVDADHGDFGTRVTVDDTAAVRDHATHVAGTLGGDGSLSAGAGGTARQWRGIAPSVDIVSMSFNGVIGWQDPGDLFAEYRTAVEDHGVDVSNNSWGQNCSPDGGTTILSEYELSAQTIDQIVLGVGIERGIPFIKSAGNARGYDFNNDRLYGCGTNPTAFANYGTIGLLAESKNSIGIGATNSNDNSMTDFSNWGPVTDGRLKPEIVAPGCVAGGSIRSTFPGDTYGLMCGTSMATPVVTGISALLIEQFRDTYIGDEPIPSAIKALLVHTARDLNDGTAWYSPGPDYSSGYGLVDALAAVDAIRARQVISGQASNDRVDVYTLNVSGIVHSLKMTLAWDDPAANVNANPALVNNLDMTLVDPSGNIYLPWTLDPDNPADNATTTTADRRNPLEQITVNSGDALPTGEWKLRVSGRSVPTGGPQMYSLVLSGATVGGMATEPLSDGAFVDNGVVQLGVNREGHFNVYGGPPSSGTGTTAVGLRYLATGAEATAPGCLCEGWGAADATSGVSGFANVDVDSVNNIQVLEFFTDTDSIGSGVVVSLVEIGDDPDSPVLRVKHDYHESLTPFLYEATVTIDNVSDETVQPRYRRVMDWDVEPTAFSEYVTIDGGSSTALLFTSDNGFETANPLGGRTSINFTGNAVDDGPNDHGALFDFGFDPLDPGQSVTFSIYYGAAPNELEALLALDAVGAEVYSFGQPNTPDGDTEGTPNTFIFAFSSVGGSRFDRIQIRKKSDLRRSEPGTENGYTIVAANPTTRTIELLEITDTPPAGFTYVHGSTTGVTTADPTEVGGILTWSGPFVIAPSQTITLHFRVNVSATQSEGIYHNHAGGRAIYADGTEITVRPTGPAAPVEVPAPTVISDTEASAGSGTVTTDPETGEVTVVLPWGRRSDVNISVTATCPTPPGGTPTAVVLWHNGNSYPMTEDPPGSSRYSATIPESDVGEGSIEIEVICDGTSYWNSAGQVELYDPSGVLTDAVTGDPIVGATVTLYRVPGWDPDTPTETRDCRTVDTRAAGEWTQPAPDGIGVVADPALDPPEIDPALNPQSTNDEGRYGWNVVAGCWYVVVEADGYMSLVSPVVGVPPEVTDLDLELVPVTITVSVTANPSTVVADGTSQSEISAVVEYENGDPVVGKEVAFATSSGTITASSTTDADGEAISMLTSATSVGTAHVTATVGSANGNTQVEFVAGPPITVTVSANPTSIVADGASQSDITAVVEDANGNRVPSQEVTFNASLGTIPASATTNASGTATVKVTSATILGIADVMAAAGSANGNTQVEFVAGPPIMVTVSANPTSIVADGASQSDITAVVEDANGNRVPSQEVNFNTSLGTITTPAITDGSGIALATLTSGSDAGSALINATADATHGNTTVQLTATQFSIYLPLIAR